MLTAKELASYHRVMRTLVIGYPGSGKTLFMVSVTALADMPVIYLSLNQPAWAVTSLYKRLYPGVIARTYSQKTLDPSATVVVAKVNPYGSQDLVRDMVSVADDVKNQHGFDDDCAIVIDSVPPLELCEDAARRLAGLLLERRVCKTMMVGVVGSTSTIPKGIYLELASVADIVVATRSRNTCFLLSRYKSRARGYPSSLAVIYADGIGMEVHEKCPRGSQR